MLDHVGLVVSDLDASLGFYDRALAPIGIARLMSVDGPDGKPLFRFRPQFAPRIGRFGRASFGR
jgi:catechol 2,3-dioxygenase-like lactoylglutathione lyase family enzyme